MRKTVAWSLILTGCLSGCDVSAVSSKPPAERVTASGLKARPGAVKTLKPQAKDAEDQVPASQASSGESADTSVDSPEAMATEASGAETEQQAEGAQTTLSLIKAAGSNIGMIPVLADDGSVTSMLFQNERSTVAWQVEATNGRGPLTMAGVRVELLPQEWYPVPEEFLPDGIFASEDTVASDATASDADPAASQEFEPVETLPSKVSEVPPGELGWPTTFEAGSKTDLVYDLDTTAIGAFLDEFPLLSRFDVRITPLDQAGDPLKTKLGKPLTLETTVSVL